MQAVIVAAGRGTRLGALTTDRPKCLLEVGRRTILEHQIAALEACGIDELLVVTGFESAQVEAALPPRTRTVWNPFFATTNNLASFWLARFLLAPELVYLHCDVLFEPSVLEALLDAPGELCLSVDHKKCDAEDMKVCLDGERVTAVSKELPLEEAAGEFIGLARFSAEGLEALLQEMEQVLRSGAHQAYTTRALERVSRRVDVHAAPVPPDARWCEVDTEADLSLARELFPA